MKLFLDDIRDPGDVYVETDWIVVRTATDCINELKNTKDINVVSLDHDLGPEEAGTGMDVVNWMDEAVFNGWIMPKIILVHSANPVAAYKMREAINKMRSIDDNRKNL